MKKLPLNNTLTAAKTFSSGWKWLVLSYLLYGVIMDLSMTILPIFLPLDYISGSLLSYVFTAIAGVLFMLKIAKRSPQSLGLGKEKAALDYSWGWLLALVSLVIIWILTKAIGGLDFELSSSFSPLFFLMLLVGFIFQGFMEEFLFRGLLMPQLAFKWGVSAAAVINAVLFGLGHMINQGASVVSVTNTILIGLIFSAMYYYHDNLWFVSGFHSSWNFGLGPFLGIPVSGFVLPTTFFKTKLKASQIFWHGGRYGFEAGFFVTLLCIGILFIYLNLISKKIRRDWHE
ncbi:CPBP family intramembrane glutamic endopeptidase [Streptococcus dentapri]|uniref:CPBP family intramembrane glutamic endopeptidase n=1 Tax=Streptococcus dentapri TaxID=573564 RepID=A0ABV8D0Y3_9STRE